MITEIVYVCSENFWRYLFLSLRTLYWSNPDFERVRVFVVSERQPKWRIEDSRVVVETVPDIGACGPWGYYWGNNKIHLCRSNADRVIYLDTDVMILRSLSETFASVGTDITARYAPETYRQRYWKPEKWKQVMDAAGCATDFPFYSPGFMIFQNGSQKRLEQTWHSVIEQILLEKLPLPANKHAEMYAFSIASGIEGLTHTAMKEPHHRYAMIGESWEDAVVYHLGTPGFYRHYLPIERELGLNKLRNFTVPRPPLTRWHAEITRIRHRIKRKLSSTSRDAGLEY